MFAQKYERLSKATCAKQLQRQEDKRDSRKEGESFRGGRGSKRGSSKSRTCVPEGDEDGCLDTAKYRP